MGVGRGRQGPVGVVGLGERGSEDGHHRVAHELHDGPVLAQDGLVHGGPVGVELPGQLAGIGVLGDGRVGADVAHQDGHLDHLGLTDVAAIPPQLLRQSAREEAGQGLALLLPIHDALVEKPQPADGSLGSRRDPLGQLDEQRLHLGVDRLGGGPLRRGDGLDGLALGHPAQQGLLGPVSPPWVVTGRTRASTMEGSSAVPPVATARTASTSWLPSAMWSFSR